MEMRLVSGWSMVASGADRDGAGRVRKMREDVA